MEEWINELIQRWNVGDVIFSSSRDLSWLILLFAVVIVGLTLYKPVWTVVRYSPTVIHEMGHVIMATLTFRKVHGVKVETDTSGVTISSGKPRSIGSFLTTIAGYPAPSLLAAGMTYLLVSGYAGAALTLYHILIMFALLLCRNAWGFVSCIITILMTVGISWWNNPYAVSWAVVFVIVFYSITGIRGSLGLFKVHFRHMMKDVPEDMKDEVKEHRKGSDAYKAWTQFLLIPPSLWVMFFIGTNIVLGVGSIYVLLTQ